MAYDVAGDIRLDPRIKAILAGIAMETSSDVMDREQLLAEANSEEAQQQAELFRTFMDMCDTEEAAPSAGLRVHSEKVTSQPDENTINLQVIRPDNDETLACIYYIHGGVWRRCRVTTGCTGAGASWLRPMASLSSWSTFATASHRRRCLRWPRSRPG
ncbi:MAG: hypothetical protein ACTHJW_26620 [Streptosporangiaceae bacterium]